MKRPRVCLLLMHEAHTYFNGVPATVSLSPCLLPATPASQQPSALAAPSTCKLERKQPFAQYYPYGLHATPGQTLAWKVTVPEGRFFATNCRGTVCSASSSSEACDRCIMVPLSTSFMKVEEDSCSSCITPLTGHQHSRRTDSQLVQLSEHKRQGELMSKFPCDSREPKFIFPPSAPLCQTRV